MKFPVIHKIPLSPKLKPFSPKPPTPNPKPPSPNPKPPTPNLNPPTPNPKPPAPNPKPPTPNRKPPAPNPKPPKKLSHKRLLLTEPNSLIGYRIDSGRIKLMSVLGVGGNGVVFHAVECVPDAETDMSHSPSALSSSSAKPGRRQYAVKALSKVGLQPSQIRSLSREFELHERVSGHPHIVTYHGIIEEDDFFFVLLDYVPGGDIFDMMELNRAYIGNDALIKRVFLQLVDAVEHIHHLGISHRDIKPENILCKDKGSHVFLADFGLGTDRKVVRDYGLGSEPYMAPQCFGGFWQKLGPYSAPHSDIWSLGVVLVNLACARNPWHKATEESGIYKEFLNNPNHLLGILPISVELNEILKRMFAVNPQARISLGELRAKIQAIKSFTLTNEELKLAGPTVRGAVKEAGEEQRQQSLTPGAPHTLVARQITNLTAEDIERLENEAREDTRDALLRQEQQKRRSLFADADAHEGDDEEDYPLFMSPTLSPTITIIIQESTPRMSDRTTLKNVVPVFVLDNSDSEVDSDSDVDSDAPITPKNYPTPDEDVDIAVIPEIHLDESSQLYETTIPTLSSTQNHLLSPNSKQVRDLQLDVVGRVRV